MSDAVLDASWARHKRCASYAMLAIVEVRRFDWSWAAFFLGCLAAEALTSPPRPPSFLTNVVLAFAVAALLTAIARPGE